MLFLILSYNRRQKAIHVYAKAKKGGLACAHCFEKILENSNINTKIDTEEAKPWIIDFGNRQQIDTQELYLYIRNNGNIRVIKRGNDKGVILYQYQNGRYHLLTESDCKAYIKSFMPVKCRKPSDWERVYKELITDYTNTEVKELNGNQEIINFLNGIFNIKTNLLLPHSPEYLTTIQIPCNWNPDLTLDDAPLFQSFLNHLTSGNKEDQTTLLEIIGLIVSNVNGYRFKKLLILHGPTDGGKSTFRQILIDLIGEENSHSLDIKQLNERFALSELDGKRLAGYGDLSSLSIKAVDKLKELSGGDSTRMEAKYQTGYQSCYKGFLLYACNELPLFSGNHGDELFNRFLIISCGNSVPKEKQDRDLIEKLRPEHDAIVSVAVRHLQRALERGHLTESDRVRDNRESYKLKNNSFELFLRERCILNEGQTRRSWFNTIYKEWCKDNNLTQVPMYHVKVLLAQHGISAKKSGEYYYNLTIC